MFIYNAVIGPAVSYFNGRTGTVTLNGSDVIGALGFTPISTTSPALTGTPTAPTAASGTNTIQIATTAFVQTAANATVTSFNNRIGSVTLGSSDVSNALTYTPASSATIGQANGIAPLNGSALLSPTLIAASMTAWFNTLPTTSQLVFGTATWYNNGGQLAYYSGA